jgi:hypothetical protein
MFAARYNITDQANRQDRRVWNQILQVPDWVGKGSGAIKVSGGERPRNTFYTTFLAQQPSKHVLLEPRW